MFALLLFDELVELENGARRQPPNDLDIPAIMISPPPLQTFQSPEILPFLSTAYMYKIAQGF